MTFTSRLIPVLGASLALVLQSCGGSDSDPARRPTSFGQVQGSNDGATTGTYSWKGVPFAKAPVGALRWKAPVDPAPWTEPLAASRFGNACLQNGRIYGPGSNNTYDGDRHHAQHSGRQRGLPDAEHLAAVGR